jgi:D-alanyl-D-alanine carboxypeptidase
MQGLHIYKGVDYSNLITVGQLLNHTSGLPDYYTDKNRERVRLLDRMISEPDKFWTPLETIEWSKTQLKPVSVPGKKFYYSDTNYQLLGLIIESITGMELHYACHSYIFEPLGMVNSYMPLYSQPASGSSTPMVDLYYKGLNLSEAKSISMSWASGGIASTSEDMLLFIKAIVNHTLIREETFARMCKWIKMSSSINYGYGLMQFSFFGTPKKYNIIGNSGSIGAFMYYNPAMDVYFIGSYHKLNLQVKPIIFIYNSLKIINRYEKI